MYLEINAPFITVKARAFRDGPEWSKQPETWRQISFLIGIRFTGATIAAVPVGSGAV